ncbi:hypothetical protein AB5J62_09595 [Amycolatopsis sp. cg5]|uniref:hypothetical protein n=1 Tax=Amycolatopsis sp. cg5 TaxID=3238802 RepID=UPI00352356D9
MDDRSIDTHPDLMNPDWRKHAEKEAWAEVRKTQRKKRGFWRRPSLWVVLGLVVLVGAAVVVRQVKGQTTNDPAAAPLTPSSAPTAAPSTLPRTAKVDLTQPFLNTPAALWKDGLDGLEVPTAEPLGTITADQVTSAYDQVKKTITATVLDRNGIEKRDHGALYEALGARSAKPVKEVLEGPDKTKVSSYLTEVADGFHLLPAGPRLKGKLSAQAGERKGEVIIKASYVVAYAFDAPDPGKLNGPGDIVAFRREEVRYAVYTPKVGGGVYFDGGESQVFSMACGAAKAGYLAPFYSEVTIGNGPGVSDEARIYDPDKPIDNSGPGCE